MEIRLLIGSLYCSMTCVMMMLQFNYAMSPWTVLSGVDADKQVQFAEIGMGGVRTCRTFANNTDTSVNSSITFTCQLDRFGQSALDGGIVVLYALGTAAQLYFAFYSMPNLAFGEGRPPFAWNMTSILFLIAFLLPAASLFVIALVLKTVLWPMSISARLSQFDSSQQLTVQDTGNADSFVAIAQGTIFVINFSASLMRTSRVAAEDQPQLHQQQQIPVNIEEA